ncbi:retinol dehydrogenase 12-like protein [Rhizophagus irregularis DAOM 181602=DAOM 197198]|uniref:Retinol dehydrogenase 12-like protein n=1 Tax=Rhizophagus irregularis (strain DAOM 181602 / DAOM 197198 / MUCL 43194) TaxID=747089 RepID=A0A2P4P2D8_RHIID|nr:retinol dehydrogenase 12-like protein [Rhizophagus irregularis DAOM 181602=DAOM 197198]POG59524.1 retinol dehydrogenase 12-like protein [Rhizophagus irregularis DAOM 181602=DAOM 197198]|eukprot:XP_025166390.1 retinol dehydrogenase 12-like protein [Rhizophagus irregularis DAOM 181602=DAOM 197198]
MPIKLEIQDLSKYVIILTGATDGIGKEMARILAKSNPKRLILPARNIEKGNKLLEYIKSSNGNANNVEIWEMDLADLQSVKNFANKFIKEVGELHILINNAGIVVQNQIIKTKDNLELQFQVNHLAQFLLTLLLLDTIKKSVSAELPGKIALTSSEANQFGEIDFDNLNLEKGNYWNPIKSYGNTKLMKVIVAKELGRLVQNDNITTYSLHPGMISTNINHMNNRYTTYLVNLLAMVFGITAEQGAINTLYPVFSLENKETGKYYNEGIEKEPNKVANDQEVAKKLWDVSEKILKDHGMI